MEKIKLKTRKGAPVTIQTGDPPAALCDLISDIFSVVGMHLHLFFFERGCKQTPITTGGINIFINAYPLIDSNKSMDKSVPLPKKMWGIPVGNQMAYPAQGEAIIKGDKTITVDSGEGGVTSQSNLAVAEIIDGFNIYVLYKAFNADCSVGDSLKILEIIFLEALKLIYPEGIDEYKKNDDILLKDFLSEPLPENAAKVIEADYIHMFKQDAEKHYTRYRDIQRKDYPREISSLKNSIEAIEERKRAFQENDLDASLGSEYDTIISAPKIQKVIINDDESLEVFTDTLYCKDPRTDKLHEIGKMRIVLNRNNINSGDEIRIFNETRMVRAFTDSGNAAPHVLGSNKPCLGSEAQTFKTLLKEREYFAAIMMGIRFVESVNVKDSAGKYIDYWPEAPAYMSKTKEALSQEIAFLEEKKIPGYQEKIDQKKAEKKNLLEKEIPELEKEKKQLEKKVGGASNELGREEIELGKIKREETLLMLSEPKEPVEKTFSTLESVSLFFKGMFDTDKAMVKERERKLYEQKMQTFQENLQEWKQRFADLEKRKNAQSAIVRDKKYAYNDLDNQIGYIQRQINDKSTLIRQAEKSISDFERDRETDEKRLSECKSNLHQVDNQNRSSNFKSSGEYPAMRKRYIQITKSRLTEELKEDEKKLDPLKRKLASLTEEYIGTMKADFYKREQNHDLYFSQMLQKTREIEEVVQIYPINETIKVYICLSSDQHEYIKLHLNKEDFSITKLWVQEEISFEDIPLRGDGLDKLKASYLQLMSNYEHERAIKTLIRYVKNIILTKN